jgi:AAA15 family ATPase/GTPase
VLHILRHTVEPRLVRLDVKEDKTKVRLEDESGPLSLQTLGNGVQRVLLLALALVNAKGKMLLIDEFEAGLHFSVQEKLWELVFEYAQKWNIQIFATTHSEDALRSFYYVASKPENREKAFFARLQFNRQGKLEAISYDIDRLEDALELNLEIH